LEKLDIKDRKILYHLDFDSRQSFRFLGKKIGLSKDSVTLRVKKLQEKGIIKKFFAIVDYAKLGYYLYRFYFQFQNVKTDLKKEIIDYFINDKYVASVRSQEGTFDLMVAILVKNYPQAHTFWQNTLKKYGKYFSKRVFTAFTQEEDYANRFLLDDKNLSPILLHEWFDNGTRVKIDDLDYQIIKLISENARITTIDIAKKLNTTSTIVQYHLKKLKESDIIIAYRLQIDFSKIGYYNFKVDIELNQFDKVDSILNYIKSNPNFEYMCKTIGYVDLEIGFFLNNSYQLNQIMEDLSSKFPDAIKNYTYFSEIETFKDYDGFMDFGN
jgi:Lrp/AsnC family transcriptional regulator for asnA, asnC and gidA